MKFDKICLNAGVSSVGVRHAVPMPNIKACNKYIYSLFYRAMVWNTLHIITLIFYAVALSGSLAALVISWRHRSLLAVIPAALGLLTQIIYLVMRWRASGHLPVMGLFETQHFLAIWVATGMLYFQFRYHIDRFIPACLSLILTALIFAGLGPKTIIPLTPAIDTPLFLIHIAASFAAYGLFGLAALAGIYQLLNLRFTSLPHGGDKRIMDECLYLGFILFTGCMIAGSYWAYLSWGSYWTWKIKGLWSYILWFYYAGVIHIRNKLWWKGKPVSILAISGFGLVLFTYLGLGLLFNTSHPLL